LNKKEIAVKLICYLSLLNIKSTMLNFHFVLIHNWHGTINHSSTNKTPAV